MFGRIFANRQTVRGMATLAQKATKIASLKEKAIVFANSESTKKAIQAALIELRPPTPAEIPTALRDGFRLFTKRNWRDVTVREAFLNTLVTIEVICWFAVGECLAKGNLIGYQV